MVGRFKLCVLAVAVLPLAALLTGSSSAAVAAPAAAVTSATLFAETPGLLQDNVHPSSLYLDQATGWTFNYYNDDGAFTANAANGQADYGFTLATSSYLAALHGARRVDIEVDLDGLGCGGDNNDGLVRDFAASHGRVTRLDVVFTELCGGTQESGYVSGEIRYNEPVTGAVRSVPSEVLFPPINARSSTRRSYPVQLYGTSASPTVIATVRLTGQDKKQFRITSDGCTGAMITTSSPCTVQVRYLPGGIQDQAALVAASGGGATISRTPLDGALLPGHSYWAMNDRSKNLLDTPAVYRPGPDTEIGLEGQIAGTTELVFVLPNGDHNGLYQSIIVQAPRRLHVGDYKIVSGYKAGQAGPVAAVSYDFNYMDEQITSGTLRIRQLNLTRTERGLDEIAAVAMSLKLHLAGSIRPVYFSLGYLAGVDVALPDVTLPPRPTGLHARHDKAATAVSWNRSNDLAVDHYVLRIRRGVHRVVGWTHGTATRTATTHLTLAGAGHSKSFTVTVYAVDSAGHHSAGRTLVIH